MFCNGWTRYIGVRSSVIAKNNIPKLPSTILNVAMAPPLRLLSVLFIFLWAIFPQMIAGRAVMQKVGMMRRVRMNAVMARADVFFGGTVLFCNAEFDSVILVSLLIIDTSLY